MAIANFGGGDGILKGAGRGARLHIAFGYEAGAEEVLVGSELRGDARTGSELMPVQPAFPGSSQTTNREHENEITLESNQERSRAFQIRLYTLA